MPEARYDLVVVGGGINGAGIAREAAGRGFRVLLCEKGDLACATSSASTKLIHGGLRYLEHFEFRLVREALAEREVLLAMAPHLIRPLRFVLPHEPGVRPAWLVRAGLFLYDRLAGRRTLEGSRGVDLRRDPVGAPLKDTFTRGFMYSDCWVDDARLVVLNAVDAAERGADIRTYTECTAAEPAGDGWILTLCADGSGARETVRARAMVNATGPWAASFLRFHASAVPVRSLRLVKGSHIVVPRLFDHDHAYIFQNPDRRIVFAIPYEGDFTLIGTTDVDYAGDPADAAIDADETAYLCAAVNAYFRRDVSPADVVWSFAGVRPLYGAVDGEAAAVSRDYSLDLHAPETGPPLLTVYGGKITTYRRLARQAVDRLAPLLGARAGTGADGWTGSEPLPGGDVPDGDFQAFADDLAARHADMPSGLLQRYARAYGTRAERLLGDARVPEDLGCDLGAGLHEAEVAYLVANERAVTAEDILWRRTKRGLHAPPGTADALAAWLGRMPGRGLARRA